MDIYDDPYLAMVVNGLTDLTAEIKRENDAAEIKQMDADFRMAILDCSSPREISEALRKGDSCELGRLCLAAYKLYIKGEYSDGYTRHVHAIRREP